MLDNLRGQSSDNEFFREEEPAPEKPQQKHEVVNRRGRTFDQITRTTAFQRFVLAVMFFVMLCLLGVMLLVFMGKIVPTFLY